MTGILGGGSNAKQQRAVGSLQFQTSQMGSVIPLVYGTNKVAPNLVDYQDFTATPAGSAKGKGGALGKGTGQFNYSASVILGLVQGPIVGLGMAWWNKNVAPAAAIPSISSINLGADGQAPDPYWAIHHTDTVLGYSGTANIVLTNYQLGPSAALPNFNLEIYGRQSNSGVNGFDANPAAMVIDFLTAPRDGAGFPSGNLDSLTLYSSYCAAAGIFLSPILDTQQAAQQSLADITLVTNSAIVWSGGLLKIIPYGDTPLSVVYTQVTISGVVTAGDTLSLTFAAAGLAGSPVTVSYQAQPNNADTLDVASVGGGLAASVDANGTLTGFGIYAGSTPGGVQIAVTAAVAVTITASVAGTAAISVGATSAPYTYTPNTTPIYSLSEDDFIVQASSVGINLGVTPGTAALRMGATPITGGFTDDPVHIGLTTAADVANWYEVECLDRGNAYNTAPVVAFDQGSIDLYGVRKDSSLKARAICDPHYTAPIVAELLKQRGMLYRRTYSFSLGWKYCLLEPMDLVQISDARLGAGGLTVRITSVAEDEEGTLAITAEDWFGTAGALLYPPAVPITIPGVSSLGKGGGSATFYGRQTTGGGAYVPTYNSAAPAINTPFILEPTGLLLAAQGLTSPQLIVGLCGGPGGAYSAIWGGAQVYASLDGVSFGLQGQFDGRSTMGVSTALLSAGGTSLAVDLSESQGVLNSIAAISAQKGVSLCAIRGPDGAIEFLSFTTATLTSAYHYTLTGLYRGLYGTGAPLVDHAAGSQFLFLGTGVYYTQTLPTNFVGQPLEFKFPSFNLTEGGLQPLADAVAYGYTPQGQQVNPATFPIAVVSDAGIQTEVRSSTVRVERLLPVESR